MKATRPQCQLRLGDEGTDVELLHTYLLRFGYFPNRQLSIVYSRWSPAVAEPPSTMRTFDRSTERALRALQRNHGLIQSGELDAQTLALIQLPRCGVPDVSPEAARAAWGNPWPDGTVTFQHANFTSDVTAEQARAAIRSAFNKWAVHTPLVFSEAAGGSIQLSWQTGDHGDGTPFAGAGGQTAHAFAPRDGRIHYDDDETWSIDTPATQLDLESVALHEIGHAIGLAHSSDTNAVMYSSLNYRVIKRDLTATDIQAVRAAYVAPLHRRINTFDGNHFWTLDPALSRSALVR